MSRTVVEIQADLTFYLQSKQNWQLAFDAIAKGGQSYEFRDGDAYRRLTRANLPEIRNTLIFLDNKIIDLRSELQEVQGSRVSSRRVKYICGV